MKLPKIPYWPLLIGPGLLFALGYALNVLVMGVNGSAMPVQIPQSVIEMVGGCPISPMDWTHSCMTPATHLKFLADWITVGDGIASPGDFLEWAFEATSIPAFFAWLALVIRDAQKDTK